MEVCLNEGFNPEDLIESMGLCAKFQVSNPSKSPNLLSPQHDRFSNKIG